MFRHVVTEKSTAWMSGHRIDWEVTCRLTRHDGGMTGSPAVVGLLLAAGAGRRMGGPKALVGTWLVDAVTTLRVGGCARVVVVLGASAAEARPLLDGYDAEVVVAEDWDEGMGASLRAGLERLGGSEAAASW